MTWIEKDIGTLRKKELGDGEVVDTLARSGLLKYFWIPLMRLAKLLLDRLVRF